MSDDRKDPVIRKGALLLSALVLTPDEGLEGFRDRRTAKPDADPKSLQRARELLDAVGFVLRSNKSSDWQKMEEAWEALRRVKPPAPEADPGPAKIPGKDEPPPEASEAAAQAPAPEPSSPAPEPAPAAEPSRPAAAAPAPAPAPHASVPAGSWAGPGASAPPPVGGPPGLAAAAPGPVAPPPVASGSKPGPVAPPPAALASPPAVAPPPVAPAPAPVGGAAAPPLATGGDVDGTAFVAAIDIGEALPFDASGPGEAPAPVADELSTGDLGETVAGGIKLDLDDALPFPGKEPAEAPPAAGSSPGPVDLTVDQYASFCAERDHAGGNLGPVLERYGVGGDALAALDAQWAERLRDPATLQRFHEVRAQYRQWLASQ